jgi:hypothetical protein
MGFFRLALLLFTLRLCFGAGEAGNGNVREGGLFKARHDTTTHDTRHNTLPDGLAERERVLRPRLVLERTCPRGDISC